ncbi:MAG: hypothetical protein H0Z33_14325 [Bacillaceae bacterium]|nr:hypothetical protein [Bacillaceae bacterium]
MDLFGSLLLVILLIVLTYYFWHALIESATQSSRTVALLEEIRDLLKQQAESAQEKDKKEITESEGGETCPGCGATVLATHMECPDCGLTLRTDE